jgi:hypothetical protein
MEINLLNQSQSLKDRLIGKIRSVYGSISEWFSTLPKYLKIILSVGSLALVGIIAYLLVMVLSGNGSSIFRIRTKQTAPIATHTPRPIQQIGHGTVTYKGSFGSGFQGPQPVETTISPIDPPVGGVQTITVHITNKSPLTSAKIYLDTDKKQSIFSLTLASGTATDGIWRATWSMPDTYNYTYYIQYDLRSSNGVYAGGLYIR